MGLKKDKLVFVTSKCKGPGISWILFGVRLRYSSKNIHNARESNVSNLVSTSRMGNARGEERWGMERGPAQFGMFGTS